MVPKQKKGLRTVPKPFLEGFYELMVGNLTTPCCYNLAQEAMLAVVRLTATVFTALIIAAVS